LQALHPTLIVLEATGGLERAATAALATAGLPVVVVPAGSERGLPIGVQVVAGAFHEHVALAAAAALEQALAGERPPPPKP